MIMLTFYRLNANGLLLGESSGPGIPTNATFVVPPAEALPTANYDGETDEVTIHPPLKSARWNGSAWELLDIPPEEAAIEYAERPPVPQVVSRFQARAALHTHGVLADVEAVIQAADPIAQIAWADAQQFERPSPTIAAIAQVLGWTDAFVDQLFITAGGISA